ncbi:MAG: DUF4258 domain-containing protein [bacterium]
MNDDIIFEVPTPLGFCVRVSRGYWDLITTIKHPVMKGCEIDVQHTLRNPDEVRRSHSDPSVLLFYWLKRSGRWICAVAKRLNNNEGFLITAYPTDAIKEGERIWSK